MKNPALSLDIRLLKRIKSVCRACFYTSSRLMILLLISQFSISFLYPYLGPRVIILFCHSHFAGWEVAGRSPRISLRELRILGPGRRLSQFQTSLFHLYPLPFRAQRSTTMTSPVSVEGSAKPPYTKTLKNATASHSKSVCFLPFKFRFRNRSFRRFFMSLRGSNIPGGARFASCGRWIGECAQQNLVLPNTPLVKWLWCTSNPKPWSTSGPEYKPVKRGDFLGNTAPSTKLQNCRLQLDRFKGVVLSLKIWKWFWEKIPTLGLITKTIDSPHEKKNHPVIQQILVKLDDLPKEFKSKIKKNHWNYLATSSLPTWDNPNLVSPVHRGLELEPSCWNRRRSRGIFILPFVQDCYGFLSKIFVYTFDI